MLKRLRTAAFAAAVAGLMLASLHAGRREPPLVRIGAIRPFMNFSTVRVQGLLETAARVLPDGAVLCLVADETGTLPVFLDHAPPEKLPAAGSLIAVTGRLGIGADGRASMRVRDSGQIEVRENAAPTTVCGQVVDIGSPPPDSRAPYRMILDRPEGRLEVVHWFAPDGQMAAGDRVEATGTLGFYKGRMQLKVHAAGDIRLHDPGE